MLEPFLLTLTKSCSDLSFFMSGEGVVSVCKEPKRRALSCDWSVSVKERFPRIESLLAVAVSGRGFSSDKLSSSCFDRKSRFWISLHFVLTGLWSWTVEHERLSCSSFWKLVFWTIESGLFSSLWSSCAGNDESCFVVFMKGTLNSGFWLVVLIPEP